MSLKQQTFAGIITQPLNLHNFMIKIPGFDYAMIIQSTSLPAETQREQVLSWQGEEIHYPTLPQTAGVWNFTVPENDDGKVQAAFLALRKKQHNQLTGRVGNPLWFPVQIYARDLHDNNVLQCTLQGCWWRTRAEVQLNTTDPQQNWNWQYQIQYHWIDDKVSGNNGTPIRWGEGASTVEEDV